MASVVGLRIELGFYCRTCGSIDDGTAKVVFIVVVHSIPYSS